jgi:hypothetical protein
VESFPNGSVVSLFPCGGVRQSAPIPEAALKAVNGIGDNGHGFVLCLSKRQHRGELFSLTARRRFDAFIRLDHLQTLARAIID